VAAEVVLQHVQHPVSHPIHLLQTLYHSHHLRQKSGLRLPPTKEALPLQRLLS
jgi:hypothetical protein